MSGAIKDDKGLDDSLSGSVFGGSLMDSLHGKPVGRPDRPESPEDLSIHPLPDMPELGREEKYYADGVARADRDGDKYLREAFKVGQYVTLAIDPKADWEKKAKYFSHVVRRHCQPPAYATGEVRAFFDKLADLAKTKAGEEALRLCCEQDEMFAVRLGMGQSNDDIADDAEAFFDPIVPPSDKTPIIYHDDDWRQLKMIRDQWV